MESIIQQNKNECFLCGGNSNIEPLDKHHIFGKYNRNKSEAYGLTVYLHHSRCHINGIHQNNELNNTLKEYAQKKAEAFYGWNESDFINRFGKSYKGD